MYMSQPDTEKFFAEVYQLVQQIPAGKVLTYGRVATLLGWPRHSRLVGYALHKAPEGVPCHRVVSSTGRTAWSEQPLLLRSEGVPFTPSGKVNVRKALYDPVLSP